jgi:hypothetical protein
MMTRLGLERHGCVRVTQTIDAMFIFSTAYLIQSHCGRVIILCYRGTEPGVLGSWLGDADVGSESSTLPLGDGGEKVRVHAGFHRNVRATWLAVTDELTVAREGRSIVNHDARLDHPLHALYVTGHSLGGAMAVLFALAVTGSKVHRPIAETLRAVYTFGQPMVVAGKLPPETEQFERKLCRHVLTSDPIPALPPASWGPFRHIGREYRHVEGRWVPSNVPTAQFATMREMPRSVLAFFATERRRASYRYTMASHAPHHYIEALRPGDRVTEFGDRAD